MFLVISPSSELLWGSHKVRIRLFVLGLVLSLDNMSFRLISPLLSPLFFSFLISDLETSDFLDYNFFSLH